MYIERLALVFALLATRALASIPQDEDFMVDMCDTSPALSWCTQPQVSANYCTDANVECTPDGALVAIVALDFDGALPASVGALFDLERLTVRGSVGAALIHALPDELAESPSLQDLRFENVELLEPLPDASGGYAELESFEMIDVQLSAAAAGSALPTALADVESLQVFRVINSAFTGPIAPKFGEHAALRTFVVERTELTGALPTFGSNNRLVEFNVQHNDLLSAFDDQGIFHGHFLTTFILSANIDLVGDVPQSMGSGLALTHLELCDNPKLEGTFPETLRYAYNLRVLVLGENHDRQPFPTFVTQHIGSLERLVLKRTFSGELPHDWSAMTNLVELELAGSDQNSCNEDDDLVGPLPEQLVGLLARLDTGMRLTVRDACLTGRIPELPSGVALPPGAYYNAHITVTRTRLASPYPSWLLHLWNGGEATTLGLGCNFADNRFCHKPTPGTLDTVQCPLTLDGDANVCGRCEEPDETCEDCAGVINGDARIDRCGVCGGTNDCVDCASMPNGTSGYDVCDVCDGDGTSCIDCDGVLFGTSVLDLCQVCNGDSGSCLDCSGVPFGTFVYDECDVCGGTGGTCTDCAGDVGGWKEVDECNECVDKRAADYRPKCFDCTGTAFGTTMRDNCGVCGGDDSTCDEEAKRRLAAQLAFDEYEWLLALPIGALVLIVAVAAYVVSLTPEELHDATTLSARRLRRQPKASAAEVTATNPARDTDVRLPAPLQMRASSRKKRNGRKNK